jgi:hypothetical protein
MHLLEEGWTFLSKEYKLIISWIHKAEHEIELLPSSTYRVNQDPSRILNILMKKQERGRVNYMEVGDDISSTTLKCLYIILSDMTFLQQRKNNYVERIIFNIPHPLQISGGCWLREQFL